MAFGSMSTDYPFRWDEAEADASKALDLCPRNVKVLLRRGKARKGLGKWDQARVGKDSSKALKISSLELINESDIQMFLDSKGNPTLGAEELKAVADAENSPPTESSSCISSGLESDLANLHLQDDSHSGSSFFTIQPAAFQKGKGAFASRNIQTGDLILSERPIFCHPTHKPQTELVCLLYLEAAVLDLSPAHLDSFLSLKNSHDKCSCVHSHYPLLGISATNAFSVPDDNSGIFLKASRFNHSCSPNATFAFDSDAGELQIHSMGNIAEKRFLSHTSPVDVCSEVIVERDRPTCPCGIISLAHVPFALSQKLNPR